MFSISSLLKQNYTKIVLMRSILPFTHSHIHTWDWVFNTSQKSYCFILYWESEIDVKQTLQLSHRSFFDQLRIGMLPMELERLFSDRNTNMNRKCHPSESLLYTICNTELCEDEILFYWLYMLLDPISQKNVIFPTC